MKKYLYLLFTVLLAATSLSLASCGDDDEDFNFKTDYDILQINGESFACYGYRCPITYSSSWNLSRHRGEILLPCGKLKDAQKGEYDYDYAYSIRLEGDKNLSKGSKLEDFSPEFDTWGDGVATYSSGSATIVDKKDDKYITVKFDSFKFNDGSQSYTLNGTVQLDLDED